MATPLTRVSTAGRVFDVANHAFLAILCLTILYPFWTLIIDAFSSPQAARQMGLRLWLNDWRLENFEVVFRNNDVITSYGNTVFRVVFGTAATLWVTFTASYALSKRDLPARAVITFLFVFSLFFSGGLVPTYLTIRSYGLINTRAVLIIPIAMSAFYIIVCRNFIMTIDQAMEDSAVIDGASYWRIMFRIIIPLARPVLATIALWTAVAHWNAWFDAWIYISDKDKRVLQILIRDLIHKADALANSDEMQRMIDQWRREGRELPGWATIPDETVKAATILVTIGPIIAAYPFVQKYFVKGAMLGSLKG